MASILSLKKNLQSWSLKTKLVAAVLASVGATAAIVHFPWLMTSRRNVESVVSQVNSEITHGTSQEVGNIFNNVQSAQTLIQNAFVLGLIDIEDPEARKTFYLSLLDANPNFTWIQFGLPNGDFFGSQRTQNGTLNFIERDWVSQDQTIKVTESFLPSRSGSGVNFRLLDTETTNEKYYAPQRPWYQKAMEAPGEIAWTDVYVFRTTKTPGIDSAIAITTPPSQGEKLLGVISIAFELKQISAYLQRLQAGRDGIIFIVNTRDELIASTDPNEVTPTQEPGQDTPRLKYIDEASNPYLHLVNQTIQENQMSMEAVRQMGQQQFTFTDPQSGQRYYIAFAPLEYLDWVVGTVIPESNYTRAIEQNKRILFFVVSGCLAIAAVSSVLLTDRVIARPMMQVTDAAAAVEDGSFDVSSLEEVAQRSDEVGKLARVFQTMAKQVYAREQQLKQQVQELRIEIDEVKRQKQVSEIVDSDFFQDLQAKARLIRNRDRKSLETPPGSDLPT